jgi:hypothetical protein
MPRGSGPKPSAWEIFRSDAACLVSGGVSEGKIFR